MTAAQAVPLFICSIGNPGLQYVNTFHSAAHTVIRALAKELGYSTFLKDLYENYGKGSLSRPRQSNEDDDSDWTLWQSLSYMNESGPNVRTAYNTWSRLNPGGAGKLVIIHDQLEKPLGTVTLRTDEKASAKGHNGIKSIQASMRHVPFARIGIGIGRPVSREPSDVTEYVLKKMEAHEQRKIENSVELLIEKLEELEKP